MELLLYILLALTAAVLVLAVLLLAKKNRDGQAVETALKEIGRLRRDIEEELRDDRIESSKNLQNSMQALGAMLGESQRQTEEARARRLAEMDQRLAEKQDAFSRLLTASVQHQEERMKTFSLENSQKLGDIRTVLDRHLSELQQDNNKKLDEMRNLVDEKLQKTLENRMTQSFALVNERLEQVYKGLGEMQTLAVGVGDLKKVLSSVKTRGILGEIQLGAILAEIMAPEQYETNVVTAKGSRNPVEYAIRLPGDGEAPVYLPIDSKFPLDAYNELTDAYESGSPERVSAAAEVLKARIRGFGKDIREKYIDPPNTTEFGIMFLPTEGLYAEAVKLGLVETLQREFRVNLAGPSTMAALLNSLQMGFRSVAIQKRSSEVWQLLSAVKTEFGKFQSVLKKTQERLRLADKQLDDLIGTRTRQICRQLKDVTAMPQSEVGRFLPDAGAPENEEDTDLIMDEEE